MINIYFYETTFQDESIYIDHFYIFKLNLKEFSYNQNLKYLS